MAVAHPAARGRALEARGAEELLELALERLVDQMLEHRAERVLRGPTPRLCERKKGGILREQRTGHRVSSGHHGVGAPLVGLLTQKMDGDQFCLKAPRARQLSRPTVAILHKDLHTPRFCPPSLSTWVGVSLMLTDRAVVMTLSWFQLLTVRSLLECRCDSVSSPDQP